MQNENPRPMKTIESLARHLLDEIVLDTGKHLNEDIPIYQHIYDKKDLKDLMKELKNLDAEKGLWDLIPTEETDTGSIRIIDFLICPESEELSNFLKENSEYEKINAILNRHW